MYQKVRERLKTENGSALYRRRGTEIETVFGEVKGNKGFRRFLTFGKQNTTCEWGIHMIAYNMKSIYRKLCA